MSGTTFRAALSAALLLAGSGVLAGSATAAEVLKLDTRAPANSLFVGDGTPVQSSALAAGSPYVVTVSGTATVWALTPGSRPMCGIAESGPIEPSPGAPASPATWDAETVFASGQGFLVSPSGNACVTLELPRNQADRSSGFQIANGAAYAKPVAFGGARSVPRSDHTYSYEVTGTGGPLRFRFLDAPVNDNTGVFTIVVRTAAECAAINCLGNQLPQSDQAATPLRSVDPGSIAVQGVRACGLERVLSVRLVRRKGTKFSKVVYYLNGKNRRTVRGQKNYILRTTSVRAQKFRNLPSGPLKLRVVITFANGQKAVVTRTVARCAPRIKARPITFK